MLALVTDLEGRIQDMAADLCDAGVVGVTLGGSRARGDAIPGSDWDLGLYYRGGFDASLLTGVAARWADRPVEVGTTGSWGAWVDAGAWLTLDGMPVDWLLRDLDRVAEQWQRASAGSYAFHRQPGHPLGFLDVAYVGELALATILCDPTGELSALNARYRTYPDALVDAFRQGLWEAEFLLDVAVKGSNRGDAVYVAACVSQAVMLCAHALLARARRWVTNEKGLVPAAGALDPGFAELSAAILFDGASGLPDAVVAARSLLLHVRQLDLCVRF